MRVHGWRRYSLPPSHIPVAVRSEPRGAEDHRTAGWQLLHVHDPRPSWLCCARPQSSSRSRPCSIAANAGATAAASYAVGARVLRHARGRATQLGMHLSLWARDLRSQLSALVDRRFRHGRGRRRRSVSLGGVLAVAGTFAHVQQDRGDRARSDAVRERLVRDDRCVARRVLPTTRLDQPKERTALRLSAATRRLFPRRRVRP